MSNSEGESKVAGFQLSFRGPYGNRRKFWFVIALVSSLLCGSFWSVQNMKTLKQSDGRIFKVVLVNLRIFLISLYGFGVIVLFSTNKFFINVSRYMRWLMESAFLVTCLAVPKWANDSVDLIIGYLLCFHLIPMANLIASIKNQKNYNFLFSLLSAILVRSGTLLDGWGIAIVLCVFHIIKYLDETLTDDNIAQNDHKEIQGNNEKLDIHDNNEKKRI